MTYEEMLDEALGKIEKIQTKKRFEKPLVEVNFVSNKSIITNFKKIAEYLRRDEKHLSKYLMKNLAVSGFIDKEGLVLNSRINASTIQKKLDEYIRDYVICKVCGSADTRLIKEERIIYLKCDACGAKYPVFG